jgi:hypothetical protein
MLSGLQKFRYLGHHRAMLNDGTDSPSLLEDATSDNETTVSVVVSLQHVGHLAGSGDEMRPYKARECPIISRFVKTLASHVVGSSAPHTMFIL